MIITYNGVEADPKLCRRINGAYYKIGDPNIKNSGQCYEIKGTYYRETSPKMSWDHELKQYELVDNMIYGWVNGGGLGWFTPDISTNHFASDGKMVQSEYAIGINKLTYDYSRGIFVENKIKSSPHKIIGGRPTYQNLRTDIYSLSDYDTSLIEETFKNYKFTKSVFDKFLNNYTFGLEIETDMGWFPQCKYFKLGCVPLKDGSIGGSEITTLKYPASMRLMEELFDTCAQYTEATSNNSLHVNISGFKNTPDFRVALYVLYYRLQQEILQFTPIYKRSLEYFTTKQGGPKDHCKPMESLNIIKRYNEADLKQQITNSDIAIFKFLNENVYNSDSNIDTRVHAREGAHKWDHKNRYYALNLMPLYFGNPKGSRVEFRLHSGTVNKYKAMVWIFICSNIIKFVEKNATRILTGRDKITLEDVLMETMISENNPTPEETFIYNYIINYIAARTSQNMLMVVRPQNDVFGTEFINDRQFTFAIDGITLFNFEQKDKLNKS